MSNQKQVDARGLSCPQPVVLTQKAIKEGNTSFDVLVNSNVSKENVVRCVQKNKMQAQVRQEGDDFIISVSQEG
ncbi:MAG TPA: sulfurtransferase TusA family protein [Spirochaetota bacterium]|nr:sulfurtransferase TusA family protein [Spirochaetota bacterium]HPI90478.1 sulfurtransferase TusA family protein [Spirochaetota bacterium]HPR46922.1 sulfurtransferase TusA family protein [Spirochaetota bacterium]